MTQLSNNDDYIRLLAFMLQFQILGIMQETEIKFKYETCLHYIIEANQLTLKDKTFTFDEIVAAINLGYEKAQMCVDYEKQPNNVEKIYDDTY